MRFSVITYGTEGDTRPIVALCRGLMDAGHNVNLFADGSTLHSAEAHHIPARGLAGDIRAAAGPGGDLAKLMKEQASVTQTSKAFARIANVNAKSWMANLLQGAGDSQAIIFSGLAAFVGLSVAEYLHIPAIGVGLWPITPTREFPSAMLPPRRLPEWLNRFSHVAVNALLWRLFRTSINSARQEVCGQAPRAAMWRDYPILYGFSHKLVAKPTDWPDNHHVCGAWPLASPQWRPPSALAEFLAAGEPPIYVGFGSMGGFDREKMGQVIIQAVSGRRALFYPGWSGIDPSSLPQNFFVLADTPHDWLFPQTSVVIHHGGAGTSHSAARAGVPSVVLPFAGDQFFWANRLAQAGIGAHVHTRKQNNPRRFIENDQIYTNS